MLEVTFLPESGILIVSLLELTRKVTPSIEGASAASGGSASVNGMTTSTVDPARNAAGVLVRLSPMKIGLFELNRSHYIRRKKVS